MNVFQDETGSDKHWQALHQELEWFVKVLEIRDTFFRAGDNIFNSSCGLSYGFFQSISKQK